MTQGLAKSNTLSERLCNSVADALSTGASPFDQEFANLELPDDGFSVHDEPSANWLIRKITECRSYAERVTAWAAAEIRRAEREEQFFFFHFGRQLEHWASEEIQKFKGRRKSLNLPAGTVGFRAEASKLIVTDDRRLLAWCARCLPTAITVTVEATGSDAAKLRDWQQANCVGAFITEHVAKSVVNQHVKENGELPDGVEQLTVGAKFFVK